jgi:L-fuculose-phosphate aldolase
VHAHPPTATGFAVAGIPLDRAVLAEVVTTLGSVPIAEYATPSTKELPEAVRQYVQAHDGMLLANHGALTMGKDLFSAYYKMETIEHFAKISLVARLLGGERILSREEVFRLQDLRGHYGIAAPAPICADPPAGTPADCQVVQAPSAPGQRLVPDYAAFPNAGPDSSGRQNDLAGLIARRTHPPGSVPADREIRLTYGELTALIEDAVRSLK